MNKSETVKTEILSFVDEYVQSLPYFHPNEVVLECSECEKVLYGTNRETLQLEQLQPSDFTPIEPQTEHPSYHVTCVHCKKETSPFINYLHEGHRRNTNENK